MPLAVSLQARQVHVLVGVTVSRSGHGVGETCDQNSTPSSVWADLAKSWRNGGGYTEIARIVLGGVRRDGVDNARCFNCRA